MRPEQLRIARDGVTAQVILIEALGAETLVHCAIGQDRLILRDGHGSRLKLGQTLCLDAEVEAVVFFDAAGRTMAREIAPALTVVE